ncbi:MAG TPA: carbamoyltransferase HypF [Candidatus Bathyarchaeia archaeon]|nr:carbamoyltransferase HypF [Candidatus Bathyarchaeia archaeon]
MHAEIIISGIVQGVGFRPFVYRIAVKNSLLGHVRNLGDARVEIVVEGPETRVERFLLELEEEKPPLSQIHDMKVKRSEDKGGLSAFAIQMSSLGRAIPGSSIPPDIGICGECLRELRDPANRRHEYFFITCTDCGPRFTIIRRLPYDRLNTTMAEFHMCDRCRQEYSDPMNRRFHAQTVACAECGPRVYLTDRDGQVLNQQDPIMEAGRLLADGSIVAIKGNGGYHLASSATKDQPIVKLREIKHRRQKPFAIMARDLPSVKSFSELDVEEEAELCSVRKPIVLLDKNKDYYLSDLIAPNLDSIGVMLPYTGLHVMLFDQNREPALIMTSANASNEPMIVDDQEALRKLHPVADYFLIHNRMIAQRADDSVVKIVGEKRKFIRRSRGFAPTPIRISQPSKRTILALGAEMNVTSCVFQGENAFLSQHVGDVETYETLQFLKDATDHLLGLCGCKPQVISCDLHPRYATTKLAREMGEKLSIPVIAVQHHHAHAAALMMEHGLDEIVGIICDGVGYGLDGTTWGGEILHVSQKGFKRVGHLQEQPMVGGDLATNFPARIVAGVLYKDEVARDWFMNNSSSLLPHGKTEAQLIIKQLYSGNTMTTSSCGRILDAVSVLLGTCNERTYEGEPAMKLEAVAKKGRDALKLEPQVKEGVLNTTYLLQQVFENRSRLAVPDLAHSAQSYLAKGMAKIATEEALSLGVESVGFSGGVAYNAQITRMIKSVVEEISLTFIEHNDVPPGDGGTSFGQAAAVALAD